MAPSRRTVLTTGAAGLVTAAAAAHAQTTGQGSLPQPMRPGRGGTNSGPRNLPIEMQNPDIFVPPATDHGTLPNLKFPFSATHMRIERGGWTRQVTERELAISTDLALVNMRLKAGGVRELHWHKPAEWAFMLKGRARITAIDEEGRLPGRRRRRGPVELPVRHPALDPGPGGRRLRVPARLRRRELQRRQHVLGHRLARPYPPRSWPRTSACRRRPSAHAGPRGALHLPATVPGPLTADRVAGAGPLPNPFSYRLLAQEPIRTKGGTVRISDSTTFPAATTIAAAFVEVEPGGMRELHWHPNANEGQYYISGQARMTVFAAGQAGTFDYQPGDVGFVPRNMGHYIENTGDTKLQFLELWRTGKFADVSLNRWMALTPPELVQGTLKLDQSVMSALRRGPAPVVPV